MMQKAQVAKAVIPAMLLVPAFWLRLYTKPVINYRKRCASVLLRSSAVFRLGA